MGDITGAKQPIIIFIMRFGGEQDLTESINIQI